MTQDTSSHAAIMSDVVGLLDRLAEDWEYSGEIVPETWLFSDLGFESIDAVVLSSHVQKHFAQQFPFPELLAELGAREVKDLQVKELVDFIVMHRESGAA